MVYAEVCLDGYKAGYLSFDAGIYLFRYSKSYLEKNSAVAISLTLPLQGDPFFSNYLFSCFTEMLSEGALKKQQCLALKIDEKDYFKRLLHTCSGDTIGAITIKAIES